MQLKYGELTMFIAEVRGILTTEASVERSFGSMKERMRPRRNRLHQRNLNDELQISLNWIKLFNTDTLTTRKPREQWMSRNMWVALAGSLVEPLMDPGVVTRRAQKNNEARELAVGDHVVVWHWHKEPATTGSWYKGIIVAKNTETSECNRPTFKVFYDQEEWKKKKGVEGAYVAEIFAFDPVVEDRDWHRAAEFVEGMQPKEGRKPK